MAFLTILGYLFPIVGLIVLFFNSFVGIGLILFGLGAILFHQSETLINQNNVVIELLNKLLNEIQNKDGGG